jgi:hypothetical protein
MSRRRVPSSSWLRNQADIGSRTGVYRLRRDRASARLASVLALPMDAPYMLIDRTSDGSSALDPIPIRSTLMVPSDD